MAELTGRWTRMAAFVSLIGLLVLCQSGSEVNGKSLAKNRKSDKTNEEYDYATSSPIDGGTKQDEDMYDDFLNSLLNDLKNSSDGFGNSTELASDLTNATDDTPLVNNNTSVNGVNTTLSNDTSSINFTNPSGIFGNSSYNGSTVLGSNNTLNGMLNNITSFLGQNGTFSNNSLQTNNATTSENITTNLNNENSTVNNNETMGNTTQFNSSNYSSLLNDTGTTLNGSLTVSTPGTTNTPTVQPSTQNPSTAATTQYTTTQYPTTEASTQYTTTVPTTQYTTTVPTTQYTTTVAPTEKPSTAATTRATPGVGVASTTPYIPLYSGFFSSTPATQNYNEPTSAGSAYTTYTTTTQYPLYTSTIEYINGLQNYWNQRDKHYVTTVLIPVAAGVLGALFIVLVAYSIKNCGRKRQYTQMHSLPQNSQQSPRDRVMLLADSSDEDF